MAYLSRVRSATSVAISGEVAEEAALADLDVGLHRHAGGEEDVGQVRQLLPVDQHVGAVVLLPGLIIHLFIADEQVIEYGSHFLRGFSLAMPFLVVDFMAVGVFQAVGLGKAALAFALLRKIAALGLGKGDFRRIFAQ